MRFLTASLHVDYLLPTPLSRPIEVRARLKAVKSHKVGAEANLIARGNVCAKGKVMTVQVPEHMMTALMK